MNAAAAGTSGDTDELAAHSGLAVTPSTSVATEHLAADGGHAAAGYGDPLTSGVERLLENSCQPSALVSGCR